MRYAPICCKRRSKPLMSIISHSKLWRAHIFVTNSKPCSACGQGWRLLPKAGTVHSQRCTDICGHTFQTIPARNRLAFQPRPK